MNNKIFSRTLLAIATGSIAALAVLPALASTDKTATFNVTLSVSSDCSISATDLAFGVADSTLATAPINHNTNLTVTCTTGTGYTLSLDAGSVGTSTIAARQMAGVTATNKVRYQLYTNSPGGTVWGDGTGGSGTVPGTGNGSAQSITIYGQVPAQTIPPVDSYSSVETATITF
ncbi:MAG: pilus biosis protein [Nevskia sp.]|nr:pilus biosis protein [Nevskia sp.]